MSTTGAPTTRFAAASVWTGSKLIVFGGQQDLTSLTLVDGGVYDRHSDTWTSMSTDGAPTPRRYFSSVWTGTEMVVWGGVDFTLCWTNCPTFPTSLNTGSLYNPSTNSWRPMSTVGAPSGRAGAVAVWTGNKLIVWGGGNPWSTEFSDQGAAYDPVTDTWSAISSENAPSARENAGFAWSGGKLYVFGGRDRYNLYLNTGATYDPLTDTWTALPTLLAPSARVSPTILWTGSSLYVVGGIANTDHSPVAGGRLGKDNLPHSTRAFIPVGSPRVPSPWGEVTGVPAQTIWSTVTFGNGKFVALSASGIGGISSDGSSWTTTTIPSGEWISAAYGNGTYIAITVDGGLTTSSDGITWTSGTALPASGSWQSIIFANGKFVAVGGSGWPSAGAAAVSSDGVTWIKSVLPDGVQWLSVTYGNGLYVAVGGGPSAIVVNSPDAITWTVRNLPRADWWTGVAYGNGRFIAFTNPGSGSAEGATSTDGVTWTPLQMPSIQHWRSVIFADGKFVALAWSSKVSAVSPDGLTWSQFELPLFGCWRSLANGQGHFVAAAGATGAGGDILATAVFP